MITSLVMAAWLTVPPTAPGVDGVEATWRMTRTVEARGPGAIDTEQESRWTMRLAPSLGLGLLDRGEESTCLVDIANQTMTWLDRNRRSRWTASIADGLDGLLGDTAAPIAPLRDALTPKLEPTDPHGEESAAWVVAFPPTDGERFAAQLGVSALDGVDGALWTKVMHYCTAFDLFFSFWLDALIGHLPGAATRMSVEQVGANRRILHDLALETWTLRPLDPERFEPPNTYEMRPFDIGEFVSVETPADGPH